MRTRYTLINMLVNIGGQFFTMLLSFINRMVFVHCLSAAYLGVSGLFTDVLSILNFAELGIGTAMVFSMYEPAARDDEQKLARLMNLYKWMYRAVAASVLLFGLVLLPFLYFCATEPFGVADVWPVMLMVAREIIVSGFRLVASTKGKVIAADKFGKVKTAVQMVTVIAMTLRPIIESAIPWFGKIPWALLWLCGVLSVYSGAEMIRKNLHILEVEE